MPSRKFNFKTRLLENKTVQSRGIRIKTVEVVNNTKNKTINYEELEDITNNLLEKMPENAKLCIRGINPLGMMTIKGFDTDIDGDDYYIGRVAEHDKFMEFFKLHISIAIPI